MEARVAIKPRCRSIGEQLPFELERGLFGRQQDQGRTFGIFAECITDFRQTAERLAAAGGAEKEARLHTGFFAQRGAGAKKLIWAGMDFSPHFLFPFGWIGLTFFPSKKSHLIQPIKIELCH